MSCRMSENILRVPERETGVKVKNARICTEATVCFRHTRDIHIECRCPRFRQQQPRMVPPQALSGR